MSPWMCHGYVVTRSCREDGRGVPASSGELWCLGGAGCASRGQPVWRSEEPRGLRPDDYVLVIFSQMLLTFAQLHPRILLHQEDVGIQGLSVAPRKACPGAFFGEGGCHPGGTMWKVAFSCCVGLTGKRGVPGAGQCQSRGKCGWLWRFTAKAAAWWGSQRRPAPVHAQSRLLFQSKLLHPG